MRYRSCRSTWNQGRSSTPVIRLSYKRAFPSTANICLKINELVLIDTQKIETHKFCINDYTVSINGFQNRKWHRIVVMILNKSSNGTKLQCLTFPTERSSYWVYSELRSCPSNSRSFPFLSMPGQCTSGYSVCLLKIVILEFRKWIHVIIAYLFSTSVGFCSDF